MNFIMLTLVAGVMFSTSAAASLMSEYCDHTELLKYTKGCKSFDSKLAAQPIGYDNAPDHALNWAGTIPRDEKKNHALYAERKFSEDEIGFFFGVINAKTRALRFSLRFSLGESPRQRTLQWKINRSDDPIPRPKPPKREWRPSDLKFQKGNFDEINYENVFEYFNNFALALYSNDEVYLKSISERDFSTDELSILDGAVTVESNRSSPVGKYILSRLKELSKKNDEFKEVASVFMKYFS